MTRFKNMRKYQAAARQNRYQSKPHQCKADRKLSAKSDRELQEAMKTVALYARIRIPNYTF